MNPIRSLKSVGQNANHFRMIIVAVVLIIEISSRCVSPNGQNRPFKTLTLFDLVSQIYRKIILFYNFFLNALQEAWSPLFRKAMSFFWLRSLVPVTSSIFLISDKQSLEL